jgi:hypothetical protein
MNEIEGVSVREMCDLHFANPSIIILKGVDKFTSLNQYFTNLQISIKHINIL